MDLANGARRKAQYAVNKRLYPLRARIDWFFNQLKNRRHSQHPDVDQSTRIRLARFHPHLDQV
jgi:hypothetical protein